MGSVQATSTENVIRDFTNITNSAIINQINSAEITCGSTQSIRFSTGIGCVFNPIRSNVTIDQSSQSSCTMDASSIQKVSAQISSVITNTLNQMVSQDQSSYQGWFSVAFGLQIQNASNVQEVSNQISNAVSVDNNNSCLTRAFISQTAIYTLCGIYIDSPITVNQRANVQAAASCINKQITDVIIANSVINELIQRTDQIQYSKQSGLGDVIIYIAIAIIVIVVLIIIFLFLRRSGSGTSTASNIPNGVKYASRNVKLK